MFLPKLWLVAGSGAAKKWWHPFPDISNFRSENSLSLCWLLPAGSVSEGRHTPMDANHVTASSLRGYLAKLQGAPPFVGRVN
jgi:hypothetical protein